MGWHLTPRGGKQLPSFLSPLISTLSTSSNLCDIWVPLCVSFLRCNHLNPPRNKAAPAEELTIGAFHSHHNLGLGGTYNKASICAPVQADQLAQHCVGSEPEYLCAWNRRALQNSPSSWQSLFCFVLMPLSTFAGLFEEIKEKHPLWTAMSTGWPQRPPIVCSPTPCQHHFFPLADIPLFSPRGLDWGW